MKKIILFTIIYSFFSIILFGEDLNFEIEFAINSIQFEQTSSSHYDNNEAKLQIDLRLDYTMLNFIMFGGNYTSFFYKMPGFNFYPQGDIFDFFFGLNISSFKLLFSHTCMHPVTPYIMSNNTYQVLVEGGYDEIILECEYKDDYLTIRPSINYIIQSAYALKYDGIEKYAYRDDLINTSAELFLNAKFEYINIFSTIQYNGDFNFSIGASLKINELEVGVKYSLIEEYNYLIFGKGNEQFKLFIKLSN